MAYYYSHENLNDFKHGKGSDDAKLSELDIFSPLATQNEVQDVFWEKVYCNDGGLDSSSTEVQFEIKPSIPVISLADSWMEVDVRLQERKADGSIASPTAGTKVAPSNSVLYNLWKDLHIEINGNQVQNTHGLYHLQCYLMLLLNLSFNGLRKWELTGYYDDGNLNQTNPACT